MDSFEHQNGAKLSTFFKRPKIIFLLVVVVIIIVTTVFYFVRNGANNNPDIIANNVTSSPTVTTFLPSLSGSSPTSPLSPISSALTPTVVPALELKKIELIYEQGLRSYDSGDYSAAIETFNEVLSLNPQFVDGYNFRGNAYAALGDYENALNDYTKAIEVDPLLPHSYYNRGRIYSFLKKYSEALSDLQKSIELDSANFTYRANGNIGLIYHRQGDYQKALEAFEKAIAADNTKADTFYYRGETYTALENYEAAISDYQAAITRFTPYDLAYQSLGYAYYKTDQFDQARQALHQAISISPNSAAAHFYLALVDLAAGDMETATATISKASTLLNELPPEQQTAIHDKVLAELGAFAEKNPNKREAAQSLIDLIP
jgi:tetratricopeptide (TPR) repeat protein